ncbi:hypothetical protein VPH35_081206 [Triticum aestivum]
MCSRRHLLQQHIAMGYYPYSDLAAAATMKIPSASVGFCIKVATERGPFGIHYARIYADGVELSHPELYNDGRYVVHGLHGFLRPLTHSCFDGPHHHHLTGRSAAASAATAASVVRIMIRDAMARATPRRGLRLHGARHARQVRRAREVRQSDALHARRPGYLRRRRPRLRVGGALPHRPQPPPHARRPPPPPPWHGPPHAGRRGPEPRRHALRHRLGLLQLQRRPHQLHTHQGARRGGQLAHRRPRRLRAVPPPPPRRPRRRVRHRPDERHLRRRGALRRLRLLSDHLSRRVKQA